MKKISNFTFTELQEETTDAIAIPEFSAGRPLPNQGSKLRSTTSRRHRGPPPTPEFRHPRGPPNSNLPQPTMPDIQKGNLAVFTNPSHNLKVVQTEIPTPKEGEVIVHVKVTGICGRSAFPLPRDTRLMEVMFISGNMDGLERRWLSVGNMD
jgi:hypothetical protein